MSIYYTTKVSREEAIRKIVEKRLEKTKKEIEYSLSKLSNKDLEKLLESINKSEFEKFTIQKEINRL